MMRTAALVRNAWAKQLVDLLPASRRSRVPARGGRPSAALVILREQMIKPLLAGTATPTRTRGRQPTHGSVSDAHDDILRTDMEVLCGAVGLAA